MKKRKHWYALMIAGLAAIIAVAGILLVPRLMSGTDKRERISMSRLEMPSFICRIFPVKLCRWIRRVDGNTTKGICMR